MTDEPTHTPADTLTPDEIARISDEIARISSVDAGPPASPVPNPDTWPRRHIVQIIPFRSEIVALSSDGFLFEWNGFRWERLGKPLPQDELL